MKVYCFYCPEVFEVGQSDERYGGFVCPQCKKLTPYSLRNRVRFRHLTEEQRDAICNGCGGKGGFIKPLYSKLFHLVCQQHDLNYYIGHTWLDKIKADWQLFCGCLRKVRTLNVGTLERNHLYFWCVTYFIGVSFFGHRYFYFGSHERMVAND